MAYENTSVKRSDMAGSDRTSKPGYNEEITIAKSARNNQFKDSDPMVQKEGFLGLDDLDKMRRRKVR